MHHVIHCICDLRICLRIWPRFRIKMTSGAKFRAGIPSRACGARDFHLKTDQPAILLPAQALRRVDVGTRCTATGRQFVEGAICDRKYRALACAEQAAPLSHGVRPSATTIPCVRQTPAQRGFHVSPRGAREILIAWIVISSWDPRLANRPRRITNRTWLLVI